MVQNHLLQLLCLVAMEPPTDLSADSIRDEKVKVVRSLRRMSRRRLREDVVRGQYSEGAINGKPVPGYREEEKVNPNSNTETYVALRVFVDNWRWADVPFYIRVGKRLPKSGTEISVHFKKAPMVLFNKESVALDQNVLVIRIQPDEGISLRMQAKMPGTSLRIEPVKMDFHYGTSFGKASPEAYERLLLDAMSGDATLFAGATKWSTRGDLSIRSKKPGPQRKTRRHLVTTRPARGARKKLTIFSREMAAHGDDCKWTGDDRHGNSR